MVAPAVVRRPSVETIGVDPARPLVVVDVDEVLGLFVRGFGDFLESRGLELRLDRFALFQNIYRPGEDQHLEVEAGKRHFDDFFRMGCGDIEPAPGGPEALARISKRAGVVILTNAPGQGRLARARWLGRHGLDYPMVLGSGPKGPVVAALATGSSAPVAFIDDLLPHLDSVAEAVPHARRFQMVADPRLRPLAPAAPDRHPRIDDWAELAEAIEAAIHP